MNIIDRIEPPRMDRRWPVLTYFAPSEAQWVILQIAAQTIGRSGLVAELVVNDRNVTLYAACRIKGAL